MSLEGAWDKLRNSVPPYQWVLLGLTRVIRNKTDTDYDFFYIHYPPGLSKKKSSFCY